MKNLLALGVVVALSGQALATNGDVVFTSQQANGIKVISGTTPGPATTLYLSSNPATLFAGITAAPDGNYYVADGRFPFPNLTDAGIVRVSNLFGSPSASQLAQGNPLQNPLGLVWDPNTSQLITVSNPGSPPNPPTMDGVYGINLGGTVSTFFTEPNPIPNGRPTYHAAHSIIKDPRPGSNDFLISCVNGGVATNPSPTFGFDAESSTVWRLRWNGSTYAMDTSPVVDLASSFTGFSQSFYNSRGMAAVPGSSSFYITDHEAGKINRVDMDALGNFTGMTTILSGLSFPENIIYNQYTNQLVFGERCDSLANYGSLTGSKISTVNLDGTGLTVLSTGDHARGFYIVPAPGAAALLGLGGLLARRRRR
ncbi:MAG: hypothetical protein U0637_11130 [Phycisphaerales bacterium]